MTKQNQRKVSEGMASGGTDAGIAQADRTSMRPGVRCAIAAGVFLPCQSLQSATNSYLAEGVWTRVEPL